MSMTREAAIEYFKMKVSAREAIGNDIGTDYEAYKIALTALHPVSREQVEKVWRGEWRLNEEESKKHVEPIYVCTRCENFEAWGNTEKTNFCGYCGAPMTDEAVDIIMRRLETLYETT